MYTCEYICEIGFSFCPLSFFPTVFLFTRLIRLPTPPPSYVLHTAHTHTHFILSSIIHPRRRLCARAFAELISERKEIYDCSLTAGF